MEESCYARDQAKISPFRSNNTIKSLLFWRPKKDVTTIKRSHTLIFNWIAFSFDHDTRSLQHCFHKLLEVTRFSLTQCCFHFSAISCIDDGGSRTIAHPAHAKGSPWGWGLNCVVANPCVKWMAHAPWTTFTIWARWILAWSSWNLLVPSGEEQKWWTKLLIQYVQVGDVTLRAGEAAKAGPDQLQRPQIRAAPQRLVQEAPGVMVHHSSCPSSYPDAPSLWKRVNVDPILMLP